MATLSYTFSHACAGGGHIDLDISFNGGPARRTAFTIDELRTPLSALTPEERANLALNILKLRLAGLTRAQARSVVEAGVTVTI